MERGVGVDFYSCLGFALEDWWFKQQRFCGHRKGITECIYIWPQRHHYLAGNSRALQEEDSHIAAIGGGQAHRSGAGREK